MRSAERTLTSAVLGALLISANADAALAQAARDSTAQTQRARADSSAPSVRDLFHKADLYVLAGFTAATIAMFPLDERIATAVRDSSLVANQTLENTSHVVGFLGSPGPFIIGGVMYAVGRYGNMPRAAHLAVHTTEAVAVGLTITGLLKTTLGRSRPFISADTNPRDFNFLKGFTSDSYQAFPSGHVTTVFAVASAVTAETTRWWPGSTWIVGPVLYGGATMVGLSRVYEDKHWASDVMAGAAIGVFAGLKTIQFVHTREGNRIDRWLLGDSAVQLRFGLSPSGVPSLVASRPW